jgi:hypothetical protein
MEGKARRSGPYYQFIKELLLRQSCTGSARLDVP